MRRIVIVLALVLGLAGATWGTDYAWRGTDGDWAVEGNWDPPIAGGPQGANTAVFDGDPETYPLPDTNLSPSEDLSFTFTAAYVGRVPSDADSMVTSTITVNNAAASIRSSMLLENVGNCGAVTLLAGTFTLHRGIDGPVVISAGATFVMTENIGASSQDAPIINAGTLAVADTATIHLGNSITTTGTVDCGTSGSLDFNAAEGYLLGGGTIILGASSACTGLANLSGGTWIVADGATWTADMAGTLNLGSAARGLAVGLAPASGTVTLAGRWGCKTLTLTSGTVALGAARLDAEAAWTLDAAGLTALSSAGAILTGRRAAITVANFSGMTGTLYARRWIDGGSNGAVVKTLAPHWAVGVR